jgi:hypothetical protein
MLSKFFLFNKEKVNTGSTTESDTGVGISVIALQANNLSYMTASQGKVTLIFNDSGIYDFMQNVEGEAYRKTTIDVECEIGQEQALIEDILNFIANSPPTKNVMSFDYIGKSSFKQASIKTAKSIQSKVFTSPELMKPKELLLGDTGLTSFALDGIEFTEVSYPIADYSPIGFTASSATGTFATGGIGITYYGLSGAGPSANRISNNSLINDGVGPTGYNLAPLILSGTVRVYAPGEKSNTGIGTTGISMSTVSSWGLINEISIEEDYTTYLVIGIPDDWGALESSTLAYTSRYDTKIGPFYSGDDYKSFASFDQSRFSSFSVRHDELKGAPATVPTYNEDNGTIAYKVPDNRGAELQQTCYVFVIRRDKQFNVYLHNHEGDLVCVIPAKVGGTVSSPGRTDGVFSLRYLGLADVNESDYRYLYAVLARFGVIKRDIGASEASRLAKAFYEKYKPLK